MKLDLDGLAKNIIRERIAGHSFRDISRKYFIPDPDFIQLIFEWETSREPVRWKQSYIELEIMRIDQLQSNYWDLARAGDENARRTVIQLMQLKKSYIEQLPKFPAGCADEVTTFIEEGKTEYTKTREYLETRIEILNQILKDFDLPSD